MNTGVSTHVSPKVKTGRTVVSRQAIKWCLPLVSALSCCCCVAPPGRVRTNADLEAEVARNAARFQRSQLTWRPQRNLDNSALSFSLFFQLPLEERAVHIMSSFAAEDLDGEAYERMYARLSYRTEPRFWWGSPKPPTAEDKAYTLAIFRRIDNYSDHQVRAFCITDEDYARFRKHLGWWKKVCRYG